MVKPFEAFDTVYVRVCATCKHWKPQLPSSFGFCEQTFPVDDKTNITHAVKTLDLAVCSKWQEKATEE
jgi:hypothetical protein